MNRYAFFLLGLVLGSALLAALYILYILTVGVCK